MYSKDIDNFSEVIEFLLRIFFFLRLLFSDFLNSTVITWDNILIFKHETQKKFSQARNLYFITLPSRIFWQNQIQVNFEAFSLYKSACTSIPIPPGYHNSHSIHHVNIACLQEYGILQKILFSEKLRSNA